MSGRIDLHLRIRVLPQNRAAFDAFLREAIPFYESPGGIRIRLIEDKADATRLIEVVEYASAEVFEADQRRVENDATMREYLARWRALLDGPPVVEVYRRADESPAQPAIEGPRPTLRTPRLVLRPFALGDSTEVARIAGDREIAAGTLTVPHPYEERHAREWIGSQDEMFRSGTGVVFAITAGGAVVGAIGLHPALAHKRAELGYWIGTEHWGNGYATEASRAVIEYGFATLGLDRIFASHFASNPASGRVLAKLGMSREGVARAHILKWGTAQDSVQFAILRTEWAARKDA
jgi:RimJ/RimL family protein N-acetyltransferase/quinol monooxygenase YgiN